jgi:hypothetical protein
MNDYCHFNKNHLNFGAKVKPFFREKKLEKIFFRKKMGNVVFRGVFSEYYFGVMKKALFQMAEVVLFYKKVENLDIVTY